MNKIKSISWTISKTELKKYLNYEISHFGKVCSFAAFNNKTVIFTAVAHRKHMFNINGCNFLDAYIKDDKLKVTYYIDLKSFDCIISKILFFDRDLKSRQKMNFPIIKLKNL